MNFLYIYIIFFFTLSCDAFIENSSPLRGDYYIQDGWIAFESSEFDKSIDFFKTSMDVDKDTTYIIHFLANTGIGWANLYKAKYSNTIQNNNLIDSSGYYFDLAYNMLDTLDYIMVETNQQGLDENIDLLPSYFEGVIEMYSGFSIQRNYEAKQISVDIMNWQSENSILSDTVKSKYQQSVYFSKQVDQNFVFQHDENITYKELLILRIESLIILDKIDDAILDYKQLIELENNLFLDSDCKDGISSQNLVECLCIISYGGSCPIDG